MDRQKDCNVFFPVYPKAMISAGPYRGENLTKQQMLSLQMPGWLSNNTDSSFVLFQKASILKYLCQKRLQFERSFYNLKTKKQFKAKRYIKEAIPELRSQPNKSSVCIRFFLVNVYSSGQGPWGPLCPPLLWHYAPSECSVTISNRC